MDPSRKDDLLAWLSFLFAVLLVVVGIGWISGALQTNGFVWVNVGGRNFFAGSYTPPPPAAPAAVPTSRPSAYQGYDDGVIPDPYGARARREGWISPN